MPVWPSLRAVLITLALAVGLVAGLPVPMSENASRKHPALAGFAAKVSVAQGFLLGPFRWIGDTFSLGQRWNLFASASSVRTRLWVEARGAPDEGFRLLYRSHDDAHTFGRRLLEHRRIRGAWNPGRSGPREGYAAFTRWLSRRILLERTELSAVRVRMELIDILPRGRGFEPTGRFVYEVEHGREVLR